VASLKEDAERRLITMCDERKELAPLEDGYLYYFPSVGGAIAPWELRAIADELDRRNADWDRKVQEALSSG
jgi:hypothetical protein